MRIASQEALRNRLTISGLAVCMVLAATLQLNGRSLFAVDAAKANNAFATLNERARAAAGKVAGTGGVANPRGPVARLLETAHNDYASRPESDAVAPSVAPARPAADLFTLVTPATVETADAALPEVRTGMGGSGTPPSPGDLLLQSPPVSGPGGIAPASNGGGTPTGGPTPAPTPTAAPTPSATPTSPVVTPTAPATPPVVIPTTTPTAVPTPTPTATVPTTQPTGPTVPVSTPTPQASPTTPTVPTTPVSPVPEPEGWALLIAGVGLGGALLRWRRDTLLAARRQA